MSAGSQNSSHPYNGSKASRAMRKLGKLNRGQPRAIDIKKLERILKRKSGGPTE